MEKIEGLDGLRGIAFLLVFISHIGTPELECLGQYGVSVFLIMSGFLLTYNYWNKKVLNGFDFAIRKLLYLYPLHLICMLAMIVMRCIFNPYSEMEVGMLMRKVYLNCLMIQEWYSFDRVLSINPTAWYISTLLLVYALFPFILLTMKKKWDGRRAIALMICAIVLQAFIGFIAEYLFSISECYSLGINRNVLWWLCYYYPPTRFLDFYIGCNLGYIYLNNKKDGFKKIMVNHKLGGRSVLLLKYL